MADDYLTAAEMVADALDVARTETSDVLNASPTVAVLPMTDTADGSSLHKFAKYSAEPVVGFRAENAARDYDNSTDTIVSVSCKILDCSWKVDSANARSWRDGGAAGLIAREGQRHLQAAMFRLEKQIFYGTTSPGASAGFDGFLDSNALDTLSDTMVINAGGTTASEQSSVWAIRAGFDDVRLVTPVAQGLALGETIEQEGSGSFPVFYTPASWYVGLQVGALYSVGRVANISTTTDSKPLTDDLLSDLISLFPSGSPPTHFCMNRTRLKDLQQGRTATSPSGAPSNFPESAFGIPIISTDAITDTEAVET